MERGIVSFHQDVEGDWVARLECGHRQHVRHRPPFLLRPWVDDPDGRASRLGTPLQCPLCDRAEVPDDLGPVRASVTWDEQTLPPAMLGEHRLGTSRWGVLRVLTGRVRFVLTGDADVSHLLEAGATQAIPPGVPHRLEVLGPVRLTIDFFAVPGSERPPSGGEEAAGEGGDEPGDVADDEGDEGGDPACWAGLVCEECGAVVGPDPHRPGCPNAEAEGVSEYDMR